MFVNPAEIGKSVAPNPYFPLVRGRTWIYKGGTETITVTVTADNKDILGVTCAVIHDVVKDNGEVIEDTQDWYAQDIYGNVWYFGEIVQEMQDGELVNIAGSWKAGVDGAKPGIIMKAAPLVGDAYRQEFALGNAEDMCEILSLAGSATVPGATCNSDCLITKDFTPLEPDIIEYKYYAPHVGLVLEVNPKTGDRVELVQIKNSFWRPLPRACHPLSQRQLRRDRLPEKYRWSLPGNSVMRYALNESRPFALRPRA